MVAAGLPTLPPVFARLARLAGVGRRLSETGVGLERIDYATLLFGWLLTAIGWAVTGLSLWATLRGMGEDSLEPLDSLPLSR